MPSEPPAHCSVCGHALTSRTRSCPNCGSPVGVGTPVRNEKGGRAPPAHLPPEVRQRVDRLGRWHEAARALNVHVPELPAWVEGLAGGEQQEERWDEMLRGLERSAHHEIAQALEGWGRDALSRLARLEAYGLPSPTERKTLEAIQRALRTGDVERALSLYPKVDQVLGFKERNLNDAREALEGLQLLAADVEALGLPVLWPDGGLLARLERNLKAGRAPETLKQASDLRREAQARLLKVLPARIQQAAEETAREKGAGRDVKMEASLLARAARAAHRGQAEQALRDLVRFQSQRSLDPFRIAEARTRENPSS